MSIYYLRPIEKCERGGVRTFPAPVLWRAFQRIEQRESGRDGHFSWLLFLGACFKKGGKWHQGLELGFTVRSGFISRFHCTREGGGFRKGSQACMAFWTQGKAIFSPQPFCDLPPGHNALPLNMSTLINHVGNYRIPGKNGKATKKQQFSDKTGPSFLQWCTSSLIGTLSCSAGSGEPQLEDGNSRIRPQRGHNLRWYCLLFPMVKWSKVTVRDVWLFMTHGWQSMGLPGQNRC